MSGLNPQERIKAVKKLASHGDAINPLLREIVECVKERDIPQAQMTALQLVWQINEMRSTAVLLTELPNDISHFDGAPLISSIKAEGEIIACIGLAEKLFKRFTEELGSREVSEARITLRELVKWLDRMRYAVQVWTYTQNDPLDDINDMFDCSIL